MVAPAPEARSMLARIVALTAAGAVVCACSLSGLDDKYGLDGGGGGETDGGGGATDVDACGGPENCGNGVDDNCDGKIDCEDPKCSSAGYACTASAIPAGFTVISFSAKTRPVCPTTWGTEKQLVSNVAGADLTCACNCSGGPATCVGTATYNGYPNACATGATGVNLAVNDGACAPTTQSIKSGDYYQLYFASTAQAKQATCSGAGKISATPAPTFDAGATCDAPSVGAGCSVGVCAPPSNAPFRTCIAHPGDVACPTFGYTQKTLASTGTPGWVDGRTCGTCPCASSITCSTVSKVSLYTNATCNGAASFNWDPTCQLSNNNASIGSYKVSYTSGGNAACTPTGASTPMGTVTLDANVETICCTS
jgi:hypothetical protein